MQYGSKMAGKPATSTQGATSSMQESRGSKSSRSSENNPFIECATSLSNLASAKLKIKDCRECDYEKYDVRMEGQIVESFEDVPPRKEGQTQQCSQSGSHIPALGESIVYLCTPYTNKFEKKSTTMSVGGTKKELINGHPIYMLLLVAAKDHDMTPLGSAHDARVLDGALTGPNHFSMPPSGKNYLVDSTYRNMSGFLPPYRGRQADLSGRRHGTFARAKELFNYRHSSLRNVIEITFGVLKKRFAILQGAVPNYLMTTQINVVIACCAVHNFIRDQLLDDMYFANPEEGDPNEIGAIPSYPEIQPLHYPPKIVHQWSAMRDTMAKTMFAAYRNTRTR
ncbi:uncharacterized protein LOC113780729 [Coffea eugenioides]|uniref:uncharacterized protein LOC113780729 n=1 Tax=Coffea eugenioides TaxID=49369 RepID=UPI000F606CA8|nr:uncharacterized protein LOC113780729 [Coffea eugenioides]